MIPNHYKGREQTFVKHTLLQRYLKRLFMIIGQYQSTICYVDCFAGPWKEESDDLEDTSISISLRVMKECQEALAQRGKQVQFKALFVEKNETAYKKLELILAQHNWAPIKAYAQKGDFFDLRDHILNWCNDTSFAFFFIDPQGWKDVVEIPVLRPLLQRPNSEYIINFMFDYILRFHSKAEFETRMQEIFGEIPDTSGMTPEERELYLISLYRKRLTTSSLQTKGKPQTACVRVLYPHKRRTFFDLVYLTRNPLGVVKFMEESEEIEFIQRKIQLSVKQDRRLQNTGQVQMFDDSILATAPDDDDLSGIKEFWLQKLSSTPRKFGVAELADMLEETGWFESNFQRAFKELQLESKVKNLDAVRNRLKNVVHFTANGNAGERLTRISQ